MNPIVLPAVTLSGIVALFLPLLIGILNEVAQGTAVFGQWTAPAKYGPYAVVAVGFLSGFSKVLETYQWQVTAATVVYSVAGGIGTLILGSAPHLAVTHLTKGKATLAKLAAKS